MSFSFITKIFLFAVAVLALIWVAGLTPSGLNSVTAQGVTPIGTPIYLPYISNVGQPVPTGTPFGDSVYVYNRSHFGDGPILFVGQIRNASTKSIRLVKLKETFLDMKDHTPLTTYSKYTDLDVIPAGGNTCFRFLLTPPPDPLGYNLRHEGSYYSDATPLPKLTVFDTHSTFNPIGSIYTVTGKVRNDNPTLLKSAKLIVSLYNSQIIRDADIVDCGATAPTNSNLNPGEVSDFHITFQEPLLSPYYGRVHSYTIATQGYPP